MAGTQGHIDARKRVVIRSDRDAIGAPRDENDKRTREGKMTGKSGTQ